MYGKVAKLTVLSSANSPLVLHVNIALIRLMTSDVVDAPDAGMRHSRAGSLKARPPPPTAPKPGAVRSRSGQNLNKPGMLASL